MSGFESENAKQGSSSLVFHSLTSSWYSFFCDAASSDSLVDDARLLAIPRVTGRNTTSATPDRTMFSMFRFIFKIMIKFVVEFPIPNVPIRDQSVVGDNVVIILILLQQVKEFILGWFSHVIVMTTAPARFELATLKLTASCTAVVLQGNGITR